MKKLAILLLFPLLLLTACNGAPRNRVEAKGMIAISQGAVGGSEYTIAYDVDTQVEYFCTNNYIAPLYNANGTLKIYQPKGEGK